MNAIMKTPERLALCVAFVLTAGIFILATLATAGDEAELVLYCGRSQSLAEPVIERYEKMTGVDVRVKYGKSSALALALQEEGDRSPADLFWSQDAGALGALSGADLFRELPVEITGRVDRPFRSRARTWVAVSGRGRLYAYAPDRVSEDMRPEGILDLTGKEWSGRVGWAPSNASFQSFVTAMRMTLGEEATETWLRGMKENGARAYPKNTAILQAIAAREVDLGLPNHYYLLRFKKADGDYPVEQAHFAAGDIGNLVNVAGIGILRTAARPGQAEDFVRYLLSSVAQQYFTSEVFEFAVTNDVIPNPMLPSASDLMRVAPEVPLDDLDDLEGTLDLLRRVGLL